MPPNPLESRAARLGQGAKALGLTLSQGQLDQLLGLLGLLERWNRVYNLTGVRDLDRMVPFHLLDSLALAPWLRGGTVLDVGTGAGFPGLPLAILQPERGFTLLDSNGKKIRFIRQAAMELGLGNVEPVQARVESYPAREKFATILARAFAPLPRIIQLVRPLLGSPGVLLASKGPGVEQELPVVGGVVGEIRTHRLQVPFLEGERILVEFAVG